MLQASTEREFDIVFATLVELQVGAVVIGPDVLFTTGSDKLAALMLRHALPAIYSVREFAAAGGLISYGPSIAETWRLAGIYTGRILNGEKPADLPVQQSRRSSWSSISRQPRRWALPSQSRCSAVPTR